MMDSIPDVCDKCGGSDLDVQVNRTNADDGQGRTVTVNCNECGKQVADRERLNYKSPVKGEADGQ